MPEGDSIHFAAHRLRAVLPGGPLDAVATPSPRTEPRGWGARLAGRTVTAVDVHGKHLFVRFDDDHVLHSHLRMTGAWAVRPVEDGPAAAGTTAVVSGTVATVRASSRVGRPMRRAWIVLTRQGYDVIQFDGPFLLLRTAAQVTADPQLRALGPDICAPEPLDVERVLHRMRQDDPQRPVGDALLDQRHVAGIGNVWKSEGCHAAGLDPWRPLAAVTDQEVAGVLNAVEPLIKRCGREGTHLRPKEVYGRGGRPCRRCKTTIESRGMGADNRTAWWCPGCQR